jgi:hypothetical protein
VSDLVLYSSINNCLKIFNSYLIILYSCCNAINGIAVSLYNILFINWVINVIFILKLFSWNFYSILDSK